MTYHDLKPPSGNSIQNIVLFLHGYGADGRDLITIGHNWQKELPNTYFVAPDAPFPFEGGPFGKQWFSLANVSIDFMIQGVQQARPYVDALVESLMTTYKVSDNKIACVGFSQGSMVSLSYALNRSKNLAGVICYSGAYIPEKQALQSKPDILMIHGAQDQVLPLSYYESGKENLEKLGVPVTGHVRDKLAHGIDEWGLTTGCQFLKNKFYAV